MRGWTTSFRLLPRNDCLRPRKVDAHLQRCGSFFAVKTPIFKGRFLDFQASYGIFSLQNTPILELQEGRLQWQR
jgi:hypothetical protein